MQHVMAYVPARPLRINLAERNPLLSRKTEGSLKFASVFADLLALPATLNLTSVGKRGSPDFESFFLGEFMIRIYLGLHLCL